VRLLLDTCTFLWVVTGDRALSQRARELVSDPGHGAFLSFASAWEISVKYGLGKLVLPAAPDEYVAGARERHRISPLPLSEAACLKVHRLPPLHRDPFDRMLVCQALTEGMTIVTPDPQIRQYAVPTEW